MRKSIIDFKKYEIGNMNRIKGGFRIHLSLTGFMDGIKHNTSIRFYIGK